MGATQHVIRIRLDQDSKAAEQCEDEKRELKLQNVFLQASQELSIRAVALASVRCS